MGSKGKKKNNKREKVSRKKDIALVALEIEKKKKKRFIKKTILIVLVIILVLILAFLGYKFYKRSKIAKKINDNITAEYGEELTSDYILKDNFKKVKLEPKLSSLKKAGKQV